jgi:hypothetical protein
LNLAEEVEVFEKYIPAKTIYATGTCQGLANIEIPEYKAADEVAKDTIISLRSVRSKTSEHINLDTSLTLKGYSADTIFPASDSPFDELDEKLTDEKKIKKLIDYVRKESKIQFSQELAVRLDFLQEAVGEDPDEVPISPESLRNFISFLRRTLNLKYPNVVLTPSNEIRAQWRTAPNRHFAVVFLSTGEARFVIFTPNPKNPDKIDRLSGITSVDSLMETVKPHRILEWASH